MDVKSFMIAKFSDRTADVAVPSDLVKYFGESIIVRGLTGNEFSVCSSEGYKKVFELFQKVITGGTDDISEGIRSLFGIDGKTPETIAKRANIFAYGLVDDSVDFESRFQLALKINKVKPVFFIEITDKIVELTDMGQSAEGKPSGCSDKTGSVQP